MSERSLRGKNYDKYFSISLYIFLIYFQLLITPRIDKDFLKTPEEFKIDEENSFGHHSDVQFVSSDGPSIGFYAKYLKNYSELERILKGLHADDFFKLFSIAALENIRLFCHFGYLEDATNARIIDEIARFEHDCSNDFLHKQISILMIRAYLNNVMNLKDAMEIATKYKFNEVLWKVRGLLLR